MKISIKRNGTTNKVTEERIEMEVPDQYTQIYDDIQRLMATVTKPISFHFFFWIIVNMKEDNTIYITNDEKLLFCQTLVNHGGKEYTPRTVEHALRELKKAGLISMINKNKYQVTVVSIWKDSIKKRVEAIRLNMHVLPKNTEISEGIKVKIIKELED